MECLVRIGLKESKKYAIGSLHENGGGKFEVLERWFDEKAYSAEANRRSS